MSESRQSNLTPLQHTAFGAVAGVVEVFIMQPTVALKNALQEGRPLPGSPAAYYRGLAINAGSIAPITAIQFGAHRAYEQVLVASSGEALSKRKQILAAAGAGATSAAVGCPAELIMIQQQKAGRSLLGEARHFVSQNGVLKLYRGLIPTATRDGIYTAGYLGLSPALQSYMEESPGLQTYPPAAKFVAAGMASGAIAALITQPVDTIKTRMQAFVDVLATPQYASVWSTAKYLIQTQGMASLWTGIAPRLFRLCGATIILQVVRTQLIEYTESRTTKPV